MSVDPPARWARGLWPLALLVFALEMDVEPLAGAALDQARDLVVGVSLALAAAVGWWGLGPRRTLLATTPLAYLLAFGVFGLVLAPWSVNPFGSASKSAAAVCMIVVLAVVVARRGFVVTLEAILVGLVCFVVMSAVSEMFGFGSSSVTWEGMVDTGLAGLPRAGGLAGDANALGRAAAFCAVGGAVLLDRGRGRLPIVAEVVGIGGMLLAQSRTALGVGLLLVLMVHVRLGHRRLVTALGVAGLLVAASAVLLVGSPVEVLTRDGGTAELTTLTGRTGLWEAAWALAWERPIVGHGAFEAGGALLPAVELRWIQFEAADAHNLALNTFLTTGLVGVFLLSATVVSAVSHRPTGGRRPDPRLTMLLTIGLLSITENTMRKPGLALIVLSALVASLSLRDRSTVEVAAPRDRQLLGR